MTLTVRGLRLTLDGTNVDIVDEIDLEIGRGEVLALVGESGCGKTSIGLGVLGHTRRGVRRAAGSVAIGDESLWDLGDTELRRARGTLVSYVPQDPSAALNPALRVETQLREMLDIHGFGASGEERRARLLEVLREVRLPTTAEFLRRYPHQLSGGQQQRVCLAIAFACRPAVIVLDEPTTGLDVSTQTHVLETIRRLTKDHGVAALYVTHDLAVVANIADRVAVAYAGRIVEEGRTADVFAQPRHPYTRHLISAAPDLAEPYAVAGLGGRAPRPGRRPTGCAFAPRCALAVEACRLDPPAVTVDAGHTVRCHRPNDRAAVELPRARVTAVKPSATPVLAVRDLCASYGSHTVVRRIDLDVARGECLALVGESASGKSTLSRSIGGLHRAWTGSIELNGSQLARAARDRPVAQRHAIQYVFQNPYSALNPRRTVGDSVGRPLRIAGVDRRTTWRAANEMLERVSLSSDYAHLYPDQLSGGERQRVAIARALVSRPTLVICDEVTSALDVLVQAAVVELLIELQQTLGLAMLFVTHNLPLVKSVAHNVAVMHDGEIVDYGETAKVLQTPQHEHTRQLLTDTLSISPSRPDSDTSGSRPLAAGAAGAAARRGRSEE